MISYMVSVFEMAILKTKRPLVFAKGLSQGDSPEASGGIHILIQKINLLVPLLAK